MEESLTAGRIQIVSAPEGARILERARDEFVRLYPQSSIRIATRSSREAVRALFAAECDLAVLSRELHLEERRAAVRGGLELEGYRFAKDALVILAHPGNPVENMSMQDLRRIYQGKVVSWSELGGTPGPIEPVFPDPESDMAEFFVNEVMGDEPVQARVVLADSDSEVVEAVKQRLGALGFASLAWTGHGARTLRLSSLTGLQHSLPDLEAVYRDEYPLTRSLSLYVRGDGARLAHGFITFVTSRDGQKIVHESGLVPTSVPVRFVRRSSMRGAHGEEK